MIEPHMIEPLCAILVWPFMLLVGVIALAITHYKSNE